jgi:hypothetical protein
MLKKLFITAAAAAAVSVPLAGVAWADPPSDPGSNGNGIGAGGVPRKTGEVADSFGTNPNPGSPVTPGSIFSGFAGVPGSNVPDAYGDALNGLLGATVFSPTPPGLGVKTVTHGCTSGTTAGGQKLCA